MAASVETFQERVIRLENENNAKREVLLSPDYIKKLVFDGRSPRVIDFSHGEKGTPEYGEESWVFVPPVGAAYHDKAHFNTLGGGWEFFHDDKFIGLAEIIEVSREEGFGVRMKTRALLDNIGFKNIPHYELIDEEEAFHLKRAED